MITFNEERDIRACLESVSWADEIIVIDSLSTDRTREIAAEHATRVVERPFPGFSEQRNAAAELASGDWILQLDADERVPPVLAREIQEVVRNPSSADLYYVARRNLWLGQWIRHGGWYPDCAARLFRKGAGRWEGFIHETFVTHGRVALLSHDLVHDNLQSVHEHVQKQLISTTQEVRDAVRCGVRLVWFPPPELLGALARHLWNGPRGFLGLRLAYKEVVKNRIEIVWLFPFAPLMRFFYMYVIRLGFLDGAAGFWVAALSAVYTTIRYAKLWEYARQQRRTGDAMPPTDDEMRAMYQRWWPSA